MIDLKQFAEMEPEDVSDEKMMYFRDELMKMHDELVDEWTKEVKKYDTEDFDPYSRKGERLLKKIAKKHAGLIAEVDLLIGVIDDEMSKRDSLYEIKRYNGNGKVEREKISDEEFLRRETEKNERKKREYSDFSDDELLEAELAELDRLDELEDETPKKKK